jgi:hypothetical protein
VLAHEVGPLEFLAPAARSIDIRVHSLCNPEAITSYNIVPGRMGVVLTMTLVMVTLSRLPGNTNAAPWKIWIRTRRDRLLLQSQSLNRNRA